MVTKKDFRKSNLRKVMKKNQSVIQFKYFNVNKKSFLKISLDDRRICYAQREKL